MKGARVSLSLLRSTSRVESAEPERSQRSRHKSAAQADLECTESAVCSRPVAAERAAEARAQGQSICLWSLEVFCVLTFDLLTLLSFMRVTAVETRV